MGGGGARGVRPSQHLLCRNRGFAVMKELALSKVYQLLEPGPVVLLTTAEKGAPMS